MERKISLFVSRKNALTWLMALCLVGSAVARIVIACLKGSGDSQEVWSQIVLPVAATLLYVLIALFNGKEMFYKTAIGVWGMAIYYAIRPHAIVGGNGFVLGLYIVCLLFFCLAYTAITSGKVRFVWLLAVMMLAPLGAVGYLCRHLILSGMPIADALIACSPDLLFFAGLLLLTFAIRVHSDGAYHPTWGDRNDGRKIRTLAPMAQITAYFQVERNTCTNLFEEAFEITHIDRYIRQKRREGYTDFGITHVLLAAYVRGIAKYPQLNRFISGQKVYSRGNDIQYCMVIKKEMSIDSPDTSIKVHLTPQDTAIDVYEKLNAAVERVKATQELDQGIDNLIMYLNMIPSVVLKFVVWLLKLLDYFGMLPKFLTELSPFHGSLFFTSMGSLGIPPIYHHLYDFGNIPAFGAFGCKRRALEVLEDGTVVQKKYIDVKFCLDERIVDGYYYATFFKYYRRLLAHPEVLDNPPEEVVSDID
ncbi:MAG: hypothetical protein IJW94_00075 [Oscillospiraceae bacterium]|nr:hypothetical protein [Oscillospiraceae bacterium]